MVKGDQGLYKSLVDRLNLEFSFDLTNINSEKVKAVCNEILGPSFTKKRIDKDIEGLWTQKKGKDGKMEPEKFQISDPKVNDIIKWFPMVAVPKTPIQGLSKQQSKMFLSELKKWFKCLDDLTKDRVNSLFLIENVAVDYINKTLDDKEKLAVYDWLETNF